MYDRKFLIFVNLISILSIKRGIKIYHYEAIVAFGGGGGGGGGGGDEELLVTS